MGELAHIKLFLEQATTALIVDTYQTTRKVEQVSGEKKCLIEPGETLSIDGASYKKRYKIKLNVATEAIMTGFINEIIDGCIAYSKRAAGYTYPATMCHIKFVYTNKSYIVEKNRWTNDIYLDVEWCTQ